MNKLAMIPLRKAVGAAMKDMYADVGRSEHSFYHWAARGLRKLAIESLKFSPRRVLIEVNKNTMTATLPIDFEEALFVGYIDCNVRIPIYVNPDLIEPSIIEELKCEETCKRCGQLPICEKFNVVKNVITHTYFETDYDEIIETKIYEDGSYWEVRTIPYVDYSLGGEELVKYREEKKFIAAIDLTPCKCVDNTPKNEETIKTCCPDIYGCYFTARQACCTSSNAKYNIIEDAGLIKLDGNFQKDKLYLEYKGFIPKLKGEYLIPAVAFEPVVSWTKWMSIDGKLNVSNTDKSWRENRFIKDASNMRRVLGRVKLGSIINSASSLPIFDIHG